MADRRIIAIAVTPNAYDEIQKLKGNRTWTQYVLEGMVILHPNNQLLEDEYAALTKKPKPKAEKKVKKQKAKKEKKAAKTKATEEEPTEAELKAIEEARQ